MTSGSGEARSGLGDPLARGHPVPLGRQLAARLEAAIRDGHLRPGAPLPSTRDLAGRLGIHRGTVNAAYARLRRRGCVDGRERGRLRVVSGVGDVAGEPAPPDALARECLRAALGRAAASAVSRRELLSALAHAVAEAVEPDRTGPLLVEPRPGLRRALTAELDLRLGRRVSAVRSLPEVPWRGPVLIRPEVRGRLVRGRASSAGALELIELPLAGGTRERGFVRRSVRRGVVALVSVSGTVRRHARELAAREFERGVSFTAVDPREAAALVRAVGVAGLVLFDEASRDAIPGTPARSVAIRLLRPGPIAAIRGYLGVDLDPRDPRRGT